MSEFIDSAIRGFQSTSLWTSEIGEELSTVRERSNTHDCFAVAIWKGTLTIGHVPSEIAKICCFFLRCGVQSSVVSIDRHRHSALEQGGLEVACELIFVAADQKLLKIISTRTH